MGAALLPDGLGVPLPLLVRLAPDELPEPDAEREALGGAVGLADGRALEPEGATDPDAPPSVVAEPETETESGAEEDGVRATLESTTEATGLPAAAQTCWYAEDA